MDLSPKVIAHRSSYTRGELLINPSAYESFKQKVHIVDTVSSAPLRVLLSAFIPLAVCESPVCAAGIVPAGPVRVGRAVRRQGASDA